MVQTSYMRVVIVGMIVMNSALCVGVGGIQQNLQRLYCNMSYQRGGGG